MSKQCLNLIEPDQCKIWDNECEEIQCPQEPPKTICCHFCEYKDSCCDRCSESFPDSFWLPNKYGETGIVQIMENAEHWKERRDPK